MDAKSSLLRLITRSGNGARVTFTSDPEGRGNDRPSILRRKNPERDTVTVLTVDDALTASGRIVRLWGATGERSQHSRVG